MISPQPPRWAVRLLESLGADAEFRDDVLGDMAEEFALRRAYDGEHGARRWYVREAWRTSPHFLRDWARRFRGRDLAHIAGAVAGSYTVVVGVSMVALVVVRVALAAAGISNDLQRLPWANPAFLYVALPLLGLFGAGCGVLGGYVAAHLGRRAPLVSAFALGMFWATFALATVAVVTAMRLANPTPAWWMVAQPVLVVTWTTIGGVLRVCRGARAGEAAEQLD